MKRFTCKCGRVTVDTKQHMVTTNCCGIGYTKGSPYVISEAMGKPEATRRGGRASKVAK
jgi:hypothetical protein